MSGFSRRDLLHGSISIIAVPLTSVAAMAEDAYPSRSIHLIVGFTPGSAADITARAFGNGAEDILGQKIIVEDKPGVGSKVAAEYVKHAVADGYTLFLATLSIVTDQAMKPDPAFNLLSDFAPIALLASGAVILVASPQSNLHSVAELIALAKSEPGKLLCATAGIGSVTDLAAAMFVSDLMAGRVAMFFSPASTVIGLIAAGKLTALATAATKRASVLPDVPSMAEAGMPNFDSSLWFGLLAPAGTSQTAIDKVAKAAGATMQAPQAIATLNKQGFEPISEGPDRFGSYLRSEITRWSEIARSAGARS